MLTAMKLHMIVLLAALVAACAGESADPQVITGRVAQSTFPQEVTAVQAVRAGKVVVKAPVATDGAFSLTIPTAKGYHIEFVGAGQVGLVFPRQAGTIGVSFDVRGGVAPFDLGAVRWIGDPQGRAYIFGWTTGDQTDHVIAREVECEDGLDPTGAVCVDDEDEEGAGQCDEQDGDNHECEDGIDPATGLECDGGPAANADDGEEDGGEQADDAVPTEAAIAEHNLPAQVGCEDEDGDNDGENED